MLFLKLPTVLFNSESEFLLTVGESVPGQVGKTRSLLDLTGCGKRTVVANTSCFSEIGSVACACNMNTVG